MKKSILQLVVLMSISAFSQLVSTPQILLDTTSNKRPVITGIPTVLKDVDVTINGYTISSFTISNDTVVLFASPSSPIYPIDPPIDIIGAAKPIIVNPNGKLIRFSVSGVYKFFMAESFIAEPLKNNAMILPRIKRSLGSARILPLVKTTPGMAIAGDSIFLHLILGEKIDCDDRYITSYTIKDSILSLTYSISPSMPICIMPVKAIPYGPVFRIAPQTKDLNVFIDDSLSLGILNVYEPKIITGTVTDATNSRRSMGSTRIVAFIDNNCNGLWAGISYAPDTNETITDRSGNYTLKIPNDDNDYRIVALPDESEYKMQAAYTSTFPITKGIPPRTTIDFPLLSVKVKDTVELVVKVTSNGQPVSGAYLNLYPGREALLCIMPYDEAEYLRIPGTTTTDANGLVTMKNLALVPFTWYAWSCFGGTPSVSKNGTVLLNPIMNDTLFIEADITVTEVKTCKVLPTLINVYPNPFKPTAKILFNSQVENARISIINAQGQKVFSINNFNGNQLLWDAKNLAAGLYMVRAEIGNKALATKAILK